MAHIAVMPRLGVTMTEGVFIRWLKDEGDPVEVGEPLFEVQTDKVTMEAESLYGGVLLKKIAVEDETLPIGAPVGVIGKKGEDFDLDSLLNK